MTASSPPGPTEAQLATGVDCLVAICRHHGLSVTPHRVRTEHMPRFPESLPAALRGAAQALGLRALFKTIAPDTLPVLREALPAIALLTNGHCVVLVGVKETPEGRLVALLDPLATPANAVFLLPEAELCAQWAGEVLLLSRVYALNDPQQPFGLRWFVPELLRQGSLLRDVAVAALMLHLLSLAVPIFMQLVIDKVIVHQGYATLYVLTSGVLIALLFEAAFSYLRQRHLLSATNRIDIRLAKATFGHMLQLPVGFFETRTAGVLTRHMQQAEKIRQFLTGRLFTTLLDASVLVVFLPILFFYSTRLALIVLGFTAVIAAVVFALVPTYQKRLQALYSAEADRQAVLVETIQGMKTVKALAIEGAKRRDWEERSAQTIRLHFGVGSIAMTANTAMSFLEKAMGVTVVAVGTHAVFDQSLSVGALIAFQMIANRVVSPLVQMVALVHEYQESALSVRMLGEIMNHPQENARNTAGLLPTLQGRIEFENVTFRYQQGMTPALDKLNFHLPPGKFLGIVGRSGSGKSTLTRLIQGLYTAQEGVIRFDGVDIREIDLTHLRQQIGVVLQDNFIFRGTVRENIAMAQPHAGFDAIVEAARVAGADEFIERLPQGYDTLLEENGANLSGGQRQRLAIARAILTRPRILILDEAASALDPETEAIFLRNLSQLAAGRTVISVSHRLATLVKADAIMVMHRGGIVDAGRHEELLKRCGAYQQLWQQQQGA